MARNPEADSSLPYLLRLPLPSGAVALKAREPWPRTAKVYCHRADTWPDEVEVLERVPVRSCVRRGAAIDLVLDRSREQRSQFVFTQARGREVIFWQSARTTKQARPAVALPTARTAAGALTVLVDAQEKYPWRFSQQQATTVRRTLRTGDYAVEADGRVVAAVERKSLADLVGTVVNGRLRYLMADLAAVPHAALVVEDRWSAVFKLERVRPAVVAAALAEAQVRFPSVPIVFAETRPLAQEWAYRFLGAALAHHGEEAVGSGRQQELPAAGAVPPREPTAAEIRAWARDAGLAVSANGRIPADVRAAHQAAHAPT